MSTVTVKRVGVRGASTLHPDPSTMERTLKLEVLGAAFGATFAASASLLAQVPLHRPTMSQALWAEGLVTWVVVLGLAMMGGVGYMAHRNRRRTASTERESIVTAMLRSATWGTLAAFVMLWKGAHPMLTMAVVLFFGIVSEFLTEAVTRMGKDFVRNPFQWIADLRAGRDLRLRGPEAGAGSDDHRST